MFIKYARKIEDEIYQKLESNEESIYSYNKEEAIKILREEELSMCKAKLQVKIDRLKHDEQERTKAVEEIILSRIESEKENERNLRIQQQEAEEKARNKLMAIQEEFNSENIPRSWPTNAKRIQKLIQDLMKHRTDITLWRRSEANTILLYVNNLIIQQDSIDMPKKQRRKNKVAIKNWISDITMNHGNWNESEVMYAEMMTKRWYRVKARLIWIRRINRSKALLEYQKQLTLEKKWYNLIRKEKMILVQKMKLSMLTPSYFQKIPNR